MAGETKPLTIKIRQADEEVAAGQKGPSLKPCMSNHLPAMAGELKGCNMAGQPCTAKRKAAEVEASEECAAKRKVEAAASEGEQAREKKMTRLPQEEVRRILTHVVSDRAPHYFESLKRQNPSLLPSPEEEMDRSTVVLYTAARVHYAGGERFGRFQAFVRSEYEKRGYVEVDEDFLAHRAQVRAWSNEARARVLKNFAASNSQDED
ncbi:hypothetical protein ACQ4PT_014154 [Festuca glaucescens]